MRHAEDEVIVDGRQEFLLSCAKPAERCRERISHLPAPRAVFVTAFSPLLTVGGHALKLRKGTQTAFDIDKPALSLNDIDITILI